MTILKYTAFLKPYQSKLFCKEQ